MAATYTRTVNFTGDANPNGDNYTWVNVDSANWVTVAQDGTTDSWDFTIQDWANPNASTRSAQFKVQHWLWSDDTDDTKWDAFTIIQYATGDVEVTTTASPTPTAAPTYTVTYQAIANPSDIVGSHPSTVSGVSAGNYTVSGPTWGVAGMTFIGFAEGTSDQAPANIQPGDVITITGDKTLYAKYETAATLATTTQATTTDSGSGSGSGTTTQATTTLATTTQATTTTLPNSITLDSYTVNIGNAGGVQVIGMDVVPANSPDKTYLVAYIPPLNPTSPAEGTITFWDDDTGTGTQVAKPDWISNVSGEWVAETSSGAGSGYVQFEVDAGAEDPIVR